MHQSKSQVSDATIISLLNKNDITAWAHIYDKYASMMYGIIYNMTGNEVIAGAILTEVFAGLKEEKLLSRINTALCHSLVRHTHKLTIKYLEQRGLKPISTPSAGGDYPLISTLYFELASINETGNSTNTNKEQILTSLRSEFNQFRDQSKQE